MSRNILTRSDLWAGPGSKEKIICCSSNALAPLVGTVTSNHLLWLTPIHSPSRSKACAGRKVEGYVGAKKEECLIADNTWKYARVPRMKKATMLSIGEKAAWRARGRSNARIVGSPRRKLESQEQGWANDRRGVDVGKERSTSGTT